MRKTPLKIIFLLFLCGFFSLSAAGQPAPRETVQEVSIEEIFLARDDGTGKAGETVTSFNTTDIPIHCAVQLDSVKAVTVKMNFVAVKVAGVRPETRVVTISYKTNGKQDRVNFAGSPADFWTAGDYRIDIFIDGKIGGSKSFEIKKASPKVKAENFTQHPKITPKPKPRQRTRRN
jgi:hypothetical protein